MTGDTTIHEKATNPMAEKFQGVDFYNDFKSSADFYTTLDAVVGVSTLNTELAAAVGPTFYHIANAPDIFYMRTGSFDDGFFNPENHVDQLGNNTKTIGPRIGYTGDKTSINKSCFRHALDKILQDSNYYGGPNK